jgi:hypothetical protein
MRNAPWSETFDSTPPVILLACLLFAYVAIRAYVLPITWDEAANYLQFTRKGLLSPFHFPFPHFGANNHFLNAWLTYVTTAAFGASEFTLRLPVLGAHLLFLYYTARLSSQFSVPLLRLSSFVVLNANPYLLDFFSLSRGYGLAYGLLAGSLWYLYQFFKTNHQSRYGLASIVFGIMAVTAHLTLIHFLISLLGLIVVASILLAPPGLSLDRRVSHALRVNAIAVAAVAFFLLPTLVVLRRLNRAGSFFYGGTTSFWKDTIVSVFERSLYEKQYLAWLTSSSDAPSLLWPSYFLGAMALLVVCLALLVSVSGLIKQIDRGKLYLLALVFLVASCSLASIVQHQLLGVMYLTGRTGLYLLVLFSFVLVVLANELSPSSKSWQYGLGTVAVVVGLHTIMCLNFQYALEWKLDADVKSMLKDIAAARDPASGDKFNTDVGVNLEFVAPLNFYRAVAGLTWLNVADRRAQSHPLNDFYLYSDEDWRTTDADSFVVLKTYPLNQSRLLRRRRSPSHYNIRLSKTMVFDRSATSTTPTDSTPTGAAHGPLASGRTDEAHHYSHSIAYRIDVSGPAAKTSVVTVRAMIWMSSLKNANAELVVVFRRKEGIYSWHGVAVRDFGRQARTWFPVYLSCFIPSQAQPGDLMSVYLTNDKSLVFIDDLQMRWLTALY